FFFALLRGAFFFFALLRGAFFFFALLREVCSRDRRGRVVGGEHVAATDADPRLLERSRRLLGVGEEGGHWLLAPVGPLEREQRGPRWPPVEGVVEDRELDEAAGRGVSKGTTLGLEGVFRDGPQRGELDGKIEGDADL